MTRRKELSELYHKIGELYEQLECLINNYDDRVSEKEIEEQDETIEKITKQIKELKEEIQNDEIL